MNTRSKRKSCDNDEVREGLKKDARRLRVKFIDNYIGKLYD